MHDKRYYILKKHRLIEGIETRKIQLQNISRKLSLLPAGAIRESQRSIKHAIHVDMLAFKKQLQDITHGLHDYQLIFRFLV